MPRVRRRFPSLHQSGGVRLGRGLSGGWDHAFATDVRERDSGADAVREQCVREGVRALMTRRLLDA